MTTALQACANVSAEAALAHKLRTTELLTRLIRDTLGIPAGFGILLTHDLREDLHADTYDIWEIATLLEAAMAIGFTDTTPETWRTVQDILDSVELIHEMQNVPCLLRRQSE